MKIIRTVVEKVKTFFSKNKPDPKAKVMVPKALISKVNKVKKLKPMILKSLAIVGTIGAGAVAANKVAKGRSKGTEVIDDTSKNTPNDTPKPKEDTSDTAPSKNDGKSNNVPIQGSTDTQTKPTEVDTKKHEELEKINKETEDLLNDIKEEDDPEVKKFMAALDRIEARQSQENLAEIHKYHIQAQTNILIEYIKAMTDSMTDINNKVKKLKENLNTDNNTINATYKTLWSCDNYITDVKDIVDHITKFLGRNTEKESMTNAYNSSEMREFNKIKSSVIRDTKEINNATIPKLRNKIDEDLKEFDKYDRGEDGNHDGWRIYKILKQMYNTAYDKSIPEKDRIKEIDSQLDEINGLFDEYDFDERYHGYVNKISNGLRGIVYYYK